jgi:hypothetical protein
MNACARYLVLGAVALIGLCSAAQADMTFTKQRGGSGGSEFDIRCGAASYVSGIDVHRGWWVDGITVRCGVLNLNNLPNRFFEREVEPYNAPAHAGGWQPNGANVDRLSCGSNNALIGLQVDPVNDLDDGTTYVGRIGLICQGMMPPHDVGHGVSGWSVSTAPGFGHGGDHLRWPGAPDVACPAHQWAVGVYGRSGIYVDRIGLVCESEFTGPTPAAVVPGQFFNPNINGTAIDLCLNWGTGCGAPAADEFCRRQGFVGSIGHTVQNDTPPTLVLGDNVFCGGAFCDRFSSITCQ